MISPTTKIISRHEAQKLGLKRYFTGKMCKHGHLAERITIRGTCIECLKIIEKKNKQKHKIRYNAQCGKRMKEYRKNPEWRKRRREYDKNYYNKKGEHIRRRTLNWYSNNKKRHAETLKKCAAAKPEKYKDIRRKSCRTRRARMKNVTGIFTENEIRVIFKYQKGKCAYCRKKIDITKGYNGAHRDHIVPISKGGKNIISNIQILCPKCNRSKAAKDPISFAQEIGRLL